MRPLRPPLGPYPGEGQVTAPEVFVREQIRDVVAQIHAPRTGRPEIEVPALVAELCVWMEQARLIEAVNRDWAPCA